MRKTITTAVLMCISGMLLFSVPTYAKTKIIELEKGETYQLKVKKGSKVKCSNKKVLKVTKKGKIKALKNGKCTVKVTYKNKNTKYSVKVTKKKVTPQPSPTPDSPSISGAICHSGYCIEKIVSKDTNSSYIYLVKSPKEETQEIKYNDKVIKNIVVELENKYLSSYYDASGFYHEGYKAGDCVAYLTNALHTHEIVDDILYIKGDTVSFMKE